MRGSPGHACSSPVRAAIGLALDATARDAAAGAALEEARRARAEAETDALTGLANRRGWNRRLLQEQARCDRHGVLAAIVVVDLDDLKKTNDELGHLADDLLLRGCAAALIAALRTATS